jgi:predicted alpha/beta-hydrolase family hydrolase
MATELWIPLGEGRRVSARLYRAADGRVGATFVLAPGAGAPQNHPFIGHFARGLAARGVDVVTFNFPYMEEGRRAPDPAPVLEACYKAAIGAAQARPELSANRLVIGGKSMGGRIASQLVAHDPAAAAVVAGLIFLGYPLHPPGKPADLRSAHLPEVRKPMLFVQGSRDAFGTPDELRPILARLGPDVDLLVVEGGDHSFAVPRTSPRSPAQVFDEVQDQMVAWIERRVLSNAPV